MLKPKSPFLFAVIVFIANPLLAGSFYSSRGIGLVHHFVSGRSAGMGGVGLTFAEPLTVNYLNPATIVDIPLATLSGNFFHEATDLKSATQDAHISDTNISGFQFVVPLKQGRFALAIGVTPYTGIEYSFSGRDTLGVKRYTEFVSADGGVNTGFLSLAVRPVKNLYVGVSGLFYFGTLRNFWRIVFDSSQFLNTQDEVSRDFTAGNLRFGFLYKALPFWNIGGVMTPGITLDANTTIILRRITEFTDFPDTKIDLPLSLGFGTSLEIARKLTVGVDYYTELWSRVNEDGFKNNSQRIALGMEFSGRGGPRSPYFSRMAFRAGFFYHDLGLVEPSGEKVTEIFGSVGVGMPIKWAAARLDFSLEAGKRGSLATNTFRETVIRVAGSITVGERWFYRGEER